ncbi:hypothetical protein SAMN05443245_7418 [Paraburkholderia fungorum]|uniref:Chromosome partition protein Smc n=1 Tax=Paraburkholderia fungorum TaxID=134537 RepID=A0A1H1JXC3_9BURK|nr:hypothetical protein [Paraburkholderia fungorum]SDR54399.1 hypothetical protein SAMN05443245_7418 [Paraburkholderia fungorum]
MSNKKNPKESSDGEFDPTQPEGAPDDSGAVEESLPPTFAHIPSEREISAAARDMLSTDLPDSLIKTIVAESEEVAHSTRKILQEHMRIGGNFAHIMTRVINQKVSEHGDSTGVRNRAKELVYDYLERLFRRKRSSVRLYIRCYEKFSTNSGAVAMLSHSDMSLLVGNDIGDDVIDAVIDAKQDNPDLSKRDVKKLIQDMRQAREQIAEKDTRIELVNNELENVVAQLDQAQLDNERLAAEAERLRQDIARDQESRQSTLVEMNGVQRQISVLQQELANRERDLEIRTRQLAETSGKVETKEVPVPTLPEGLKNLHEAMETELAKLRTTTEQLEQKRAELTELEEKITAQNSSIEANEVLEKTMSSLVQRFGTFVQEYHSAQLLATAGGSPARFATLFGALADLVGKFHVELLAATRAA